MTGCAEEEIKELADSAAEPKDLLPDQLSPEVSRLYLDLIAQYRHLYDGYLGRMRLDDYLLPLSPEYKPVHAKPYPIPRSLENAARAEIHRQIQLDVLEQIYDSEMASPAFFVKNPNGSLRLLIDYRVLNRWLRRSP